MKKIAETITECKRMGIPVVAPINQRSFSQFTIIKSGDGVPDRIRFGLVTIKNFGKARPPPLSTNENVAAHSSL